MITAPHFHAMAIHFPIALLIISFISEIIGLLSNKSFFKNVAFYLLALGAISAIIALISGNYAGDGMTDGILQPPLSHP